MARGSHAVGGAADCGQGPGKHPWHIIRDGQSRGYQHGCLDADSSQQAAVDRWGRIGGNRRWGVTLKDTVVLDLDGPESVLAFYRIARHVPLERWIGLARTPRGWHIYLDCPGWNQRALNAQMKKWLVDWHGTDPARITRRGLLLDARTGGNRYVVWPSVDRRWAMPRELQEQTLWAARGMPSSRMVSDGAQAPWNLPMTPELIKKIERVGREPETLPQSFVNGGAAGSGSGSTRFAQQELNRWCGKLRGMPPDSGRNNLLNQIAYYAGARAVQAGIPKDVVYEQLRSAGQRSGMEDREISATIASGLGSGLDKFMKVS